MKFIDLFAGLGGFHTALSRLGHKCVYACEIDPALNKIYKDIHGIQPDFDIKLADLDNIPKYDILCAGFPCQPFSKAGTQLGFSHKVAGEMFEALYKFLSTHKPKYFFLENVPNLVTHDKGYTWLYMKTKLESQGYNVSQDIISPTDFNIPQTRDRFYILGTLESKYIRWPVSEKKDNFSIKDILIENPLEIKRLSIQKREALNIWKGFLASAPNKYEIISPLWSMEFGATYPYEETTPFALGAKKLKNFKGSFGKDLTRIDEKNVMNYIPPYSHYSSRKNESDSNKFIFPKWKIKFIKKIRKYYQRNKTWIDVWMKKSLKKDVFKIPSFQKFEWNCHGDDLSLEDKLVSFRSSGIRVKRLDNAPTLVNLSTSGLPYLTTEKRYLTVEECLKLQGLHEKKFKKLLNQNYIKNLNKDSNAFLFRALGNAVNADVIEKIALTFFSKKTNIIHRKIKTQINLNLDYR